MRTLVIIAAALSLGTAGQGFAQEHASHAAPAAADPANPTHEECKAVMGRKMDPKAQHNHSADKGAPVAGRTKPLTKAEMDKMHQKCAARMGHAPAADAKK